MRSPLWMLAEVVSQPRRTTDPTAESNPSARFCLLLALVKELAGLMERYVTEGRSTPGPKQKNDVNITWDKRRK